MKLLLPATTFLTLASTVLAQTDGTWTKLTGGDASGTWQTFSNWQAGAIAGGRGGTANFNTLDITADSTVTLNAPVTIGNLIFADTATNTPAGWILGNSGNESNTLTLAGATPTITVDALAPGKSVTFDARILGTSGLIKSGTNRLILNNPANSYTGSISNAYMSIPEFGTPLFATVVERGRLVLGSGAAAGTGNILVITNPVYPSVRTAFLDLNGQSVTNNVGLAGDTYFYNGDTNTPASLNGDVWVRGFGRIGSSGADGKGTVIVEGTIGFFYASEPEETVSQLITGIGGTLTVLNGTAGSDASNGILTAHTGTLRARDGINIATNWTLRIGFVSGANNSGGVFESSADTTRSIGDGPGLISVGWAASTSTNIGFSSFGAPITVALGGTSSPTPLTWGQPDFLEGTSTLVLNAATANETLTFVNSLDFGFTDRTIAVNAATAVVNGGLSNGTLTKAGAGTLVLQGTNTLDSPATIEGGTLRTTLDSFTGDVTNNGVFYLDQATNAEFANIISGTGGFVKDGAGTLTMSAANGYSGRTTVAGGALRVANSNSLGVTTNTVTVASGATLDLNGVNNAGRIVTISGDGTDGAGAVVNNGATTASGLRLALATDASVGGRARMDLLGGTTLLDGGTNTLTKRGTNVLAINPGTIIVGQINIDQGMLTSVNNAGSLGDTNYGTMVASNATLTFFNNTTNALTNNENITLADGAILASTFATSRNVLGGVITLSGGTASVRVESTGTGTLQINNGFTGSGALNKTSAGTLELRGTNNHTGNTTITAGAATLAESARLGFTIGGSGTNNRVSGTGTLNADGIFAFDLSGASTNGGDSWLIMGTNVVANYGQNFLVDGFDGSGGNWTNTVNGVTYVFAQSTGVLTVQSGATNAYESWSAYWQGLYPDFTNTAPAADPDGDGFANSLEFAFDGNPAAGTPALLRAAISGNDVAVSWVARNTGVLYNVYSTTNLAVGPWTNAPVTVTDSVDQTGIFLTNDYTRRQFTVPASDRSFFKVEAVAP